jgi:hypothetical protein
MKRPSDWLNLEFIGWNELAAPRLKPASIMLALCGG